MFSLISNPKNRFDRIRMFELAQTKMKGEKIRICIRFPFPIQTVSGWLSKTM